MSKGIVIKNGLSINIKGVADKELKKVPLPDKLAQILEDFHLIMPKLLVKEGDLVEVLNLINSVKNDIPEIDYPEKQSFKLFDYFHNYHYFENEFNYDEKLKLPEPRKRKFGAEDYCWFE